MLKRYLKGLMPSAHDLRKNRMFGWFGDALFADALWRISRRPLRRAILVGLSSACLPIPFQMFLAAFVCLRIRANLPIALASVWITNPLTIVPITYFEYQIGAWLLDIEMLDFVNLGMGNPFSTLLWPLMTGAIVLAVILGTGGYLVADFAWGLSVQYKWSARRRKRLQARS